MYGAYYVKSADVSADGMFALPTWYRIGCFQFAIDPVSSASCAG